MMHDDLVVVTETLACDNDGEGDNNNNDEKHGDKVDGDRKMSDNNDGNEVKTLWRPTSALTGGTLRKCSSDGCIPRHAGGDGVVVLNELHANASTYDDDSHGATHHHMDLQERTPSGTTTNTETTSMAARRGSLSRASTLRSFCATPEVTTQSVIAAEKKHCWASKQPQQQMEQKIDADGGGIPCYFEFYQDLLMKLCGPCNKHQRSNDIFYASVTGKGMKIPPYFAKLLTPNFAQMNRQLLPVQWSCQQCKEYYIHMGIVLPQMQNISKGIRGLQRSYENKWKFEVPMQCNRVDVNTRMGIAIQIMLPDIVSIHNSRNNSFWWIPQIDESEEYPVIITFSRPSYRSMLQKQSVGISAATIAKQGGLLPWNFWITMYADDPNDDDDNDNGLESGDCGVVLHDDDACLRSSSSSIASATMFQRTSSLPGAAIRNEKLRSRYDPHDDTCDFHSFPPSSSRSSSSPLSTAAARMKVSNNANCTFLLMRQYSSPGPPAANCNNLSDINQEHLEGFVTNISNAESSPGLSIASASTPVLGIDVDCLQENEDSGGDDSMHLRSRRMHKNDMQKQHPYYCGSTPLTASTSTPSTCASATTESQSTCQSPNYHAQQLSNVQPHRAWLVSSKSEGYCDHNEENSNDSSTPHVRGIASFGTGSSRDDSNLPPSSVSLPQSPAAQDDRYNDRRNLFITPRNILRKISKSFNLVNGFKWHLFQQKQSNHIAQ